MSVPDCHSITGSLATYPEVFMAMAGVLQTGSSSSLTTGLVTTPRYRSGRCHDDACVEACRGHDWAFSLQLARTVNEVYHTYNRHKYPTVVLNIAIARGSAGD